MDSMPAPGAGILWTEFQGASVTAVCDCLWAAHAAAATFDDARGQAEEQADDHLTARPGHTVQLTVTGAWLRRS